MKIKKKAFSLFTLTVLVFSGCHSFKNKNPGSTIIEGTIQNPGANKIYFYSYSDSIDLFLDHKSAIDSSEIGSDGNYSLAPHCNNACAFDIKCGESFLLTNLFLLPGDKININFYGKDCKPEIFPTNESEKINNFLIKFADEFYRNPETKHVYYISTNYMDGSTFLEYNRSRKQKQVDFFENTFKNASLKSESREYVLNTINYGIAVDRLMYLWKKRMKGENITIDSTFFDFETPAFIENKNALSCPAYSRFLYLYIKDTYERMVEMGKLPEVKGAKLIPQVEKYLLAQKLLQRPFFDVVFCNIIFNDREVFTKKEFGNLSSKIQVDSLMILFQNKYSLKQPGDSTSND